MENRARCMFEQCCADGDPRPCRIEIWAPNPDLEFFVVRDRGHFFNKSLVLAGLDIQSTHHGKHSCLVVIIHLDLGDVGSAACHIMDDRIGKPDVIGANCSDDNFHGDLLKGAKGRIRAGYRAGVGKFEALDAFRDQAQGSCRCLRLDGTQHSAVA